MPNPSIRDRVYQVLLIAATVAFSWLGMMIVHEVGHVIHASLSGGAVRRVVLCPWSFSRTDVWPNPAPLFVAWGGAIWGVLVPLAIWAIWRLRAPSSAYLAAFFAGFCAIANGAYLAAGSVIGLADAGDLLRHGAARWQLVAFGVTAVAVGLCLWHGLGPRFGLGRPPGRVDRRAAAAMAAAAATVLLGEIVWTLCQA